MEIRANYILVGLFTLLAIAGILFTVSWLNKDEKNVAQDEYDINFKESVRGLNIASPVLFSGIRVGTVTNITISDTVPGAVQVRVAIRADTPVREDSEARLDILGLTGGSIISISGGSATSPLLPHDPDIVRTIRAQQSPLDAVMKDVPNTLAMANSVLSNMDGMLTKENQAQVAVILKSVATVTSSLAGQSENIESILKDTQIAVNEMSKVMQSIGRVSGRIDKLLAKAGPQVERLTSESVPQLRLLLVETRELMHSLRRMTENFDSDPKRYLLGDPIRQYQP